MSIQALLHIKKAISGLNPEQVRLQADRPLRIGIHASSPDSFGRIENYLLGDLSPDRRRQSAAYLSRASDSGSGPFDLTIYDEWMAVPKQSLVYRGERSDEMVREALSKHPDLGVALARSFTPFRRPFIESVIARTAKENTLFSLTTALPDVIPSIIELPWAIAEFASDTAFLTMNQLKMGFLIAAASDREVGYREQKSEVATVIASAFGWRALARQAVGKIPFGGGLIGKAAIAYAGTRVVGMSLDRFYSIGYTYTKEEREHLYHQAFRQGRTVAGKILSYLRPDLAAKIGFTQTAESSRPYRNAGS